MVDKNKVVIKINYQGSDKNRIDSSQQKMVTEWHDLRIIMVVILLVSFILFFYYLFLAKGIEKESAQNSEVIKSKDEVKLEIDINVVDSDVTINNKKTLNVDNKPQTHISISPVDNISSVESISPVESIKTKEKKDSDKTPLAEVLTNKKITRALLTSEVIEKEPIDVITKQISVNRQKATRIFYFTEIRHMKGQYLYHLWLRNDHLVFERKIDINGNNWRASTSKLITYSQSGLWKVRLVNKDKVILNEIQFKVIKQL